MPLEFQTHLDPVVRITCELPFSLGIANTLKPRTGIPAMRAKSQGLSTGAVRYWQIALEADLQDLTSIAHEPPSFRTRKSHRPEAAHLGQREPSVSLIGSPGRCS